MRELNFDLQRFNLVTISSRDYFDVRTFSQEYHVYGYYPSNGRYYFDDEDARVVLSNAAYNTIHCGDGNDTIIDGGYHVSLNAGAGNDKIYMPTCDYGTILPGTGNDTIDIDPINNRGDGNVLIYRAGDGNDVIPSAGAGFDTLKIYGNYSIDRNVIRVGSGSITFVDGISRSLVIDGNYSSTNTINNTQRKEKYLYGGNVPNNMYNGGSEENYYDNDEDVQELLYDLEDGVFKLSAEIVANYEKASGLLRKELEKFLNNPPADVSSEIIDEVKSYINKHINDSDDYFGMLKGGIEVAGYVEQLSKGIELLTDLNNSHPLVNLDDYVNAVAGFEKNLDDYLKRWNDLPRSEVRKILDDYYPNVDDYTNHYSKIDTLNEIRNSNASFVNKVNKIGKLIDTDTSFNLFNLKKAWDNASKLEKVGAVMSIAGLGINIYNSWNELGNALNDAAGATSFGEWWHVYNESFKAQDSKKYDNFNLSLIDLALTGVGMVVGGAITAGSIALGAPVLLGGVIAAGVVATGTALFKTCYSTSQHEDANGLKTFLKNLNPLDPFFDKSGSTYVPKNLAEYYDIIDDVVDNEIITMLGGNSNDTLTNDRSNFVIIFGGAGADLIFNQSSEYVTINGDAGNDTITNINSSNVSINGGEDDDFISNWASNVVIFGGTGNNTIRNFDSKKVSMSAEDGNDYIDNAGNLNSIDAGDGNNIVDNLGAGVLIRTGGGSDTINNFGVQVEIDAGEDADDITTEGDAVTINAGAGKDSLENSDGSEALIDMGAGADFVESFGDLNTINAGADDDIINNLGDSNSIDADSGDDYVENLGHSNTVTGGMGEDYILTIGDKNFINSGEGNDYIISSGDANTLLGGKGNDIIDLQSDTNTAIFYAGGDGNDFIVGFNETSTLIISDADYSSAISGDDIIITVNEDEITLVDAASLSIVNIFSKEKISKETQSILLNETYSKNHFNGNDESNIDYATINASKLTKKIRVTGNDKANYIVGGWGGGVLLGKDNNDTLQATAGNTTLDGGDGDDSLIGGNGADTFIYTGGADSISGFDTGDLVSVKTSQDISFKESTVTSADNNVTLNFGGDNKLVFEAVDNDKAISLKSGKSLYTLTKQSIALDKSITLTANHDGGTFSEGDAYDTIDAAAVGKAISIVGNNNGNYIIGSSSFANSLTGGTGNDTFTGGEAADVFFYDGGKDIIQNFDESDKLSINAARITQAKAANRKLTFTLDKNDVLTFKADDTVPAQIPLESGGYLTKDGVVGDKSLTLFTNARGTIDLTDELYSGANISLVSAENVAKQSITLVGSSIGGAFTLAANKKRDTFEYGGGAVSISGYEAGKDRINLGDDAISAFSINGGDVLLTLAGDDKNVISLKGAKGSEVLIHQSTNKRNSYSKMAFADTGVLYDKAKATSATLWANAKDYTADGSIKNITVGEGVKGISITANDKANTMIDASAAGAVSLVSGAKNDKFTGSSNADMFVYTGGKDIFQSFGEADSISLDNNLNTAKITAGKKSVRFKFGSKDVLTIKPTKNDTLSVSLNINGDNRTFGRNSIADGSNVSLTSEFSGTYKVADGVSTVDGHLVKKKLTIKGTTSAESLIGGATKTLFKGNGGADSLVGGAGADTFFYAKGDKDTVTIANFDFSKDKLKIAGGTISKVSSIEGGGVQFAMKKDKGTDAAAVGWFNVASSITSANYTDDTPLPAGSSFDAKDVVIKANNTYYWFAQDNIEEPVTAEDSDGSKVTLASAGDLITWSDKKVSKSDVSSYSVIELNYATNLVKSGVATAVSSTLTGATLKTNS